MITDAGEKLPDIHIAHVLTLSLTKSVMGYNQNLIVQSRSLKTYSAVSSTLLVEYNCRSKDKSSESVLLAGKKNISKNASVLQAIIRAYVTYHYNGW